MFNSHCIVSTNFLIIYLHTLKYIFVFRAGSSSQLSEYHPSLSRGSWLQHGGGGCGDTDLSCQSNDQCQLSTTCCLLLLLVECRWILLGTSCKWLAFVLWTGLNLPRGNHVVATLCWTHLNSIARDYFVRHSLFPPSYIQFNCLISSGLPFSNLNVLIHEIRISGNIVGDDSDIFIIPYLFWVIMWKDTTKVVVFRALDRVPVFLWLHELFDSGEGMSTFAFPCRLITADSRSSRGWGLRSFVLCESWEVNSMWVFEDFFSLLRHWQGVNNNGASNLQVPTTQRHWPSHRMIGHGEY